jgi:hypothetical protein
MFVLITVALVAHLWRTFHCFSLMPLLFLSFLPCIVSRYISVEWKYRVLRQSNRCIIFCTTVLPFIVLFTFSATFFLFPAFLRLYKFVEWNIYAIYIVLIYGDALIAIETCVNGFYNIYIYIFLMLKILKSVFHCRNYVLSNVDML